MSDDRQDTPSSPKLSPRYHSPSYQLLVVVVVVMVVVVVVVVVVVEWWW